MKELEIRIEKLRAEEVRLRPETRLQCDWNKRGKTGTQFSDEVKAQFRAWNRMKELAAEAQGQLWNLRRREEALRDLSVAQRHLAGDETALAWITYDNRFPTLEEAKAHWCQQSFEEAERVGLEVVL